MKFKDKIVLITGASRGIGASTAKAFATEGATIIINYNKDESSAKKLLKEINNQGMIVQADISNEEEIIRLFDVVKDTYGELDVLVNNAGVVASKPFQELSLDEWNKTYAINMTAMFLCSQKAISLLNKKGSIVNIASIRGLLDQGRAPIMDYSTSKAAAISFTKTLAKELAPDIRVNAVSPGMTNTDIAKGYSQDQLDSFIEHIYLNRLVEPEEVAKAVLFLASDDASAITGVNLMVDGGQSLS